MKQIKKQRDYGIDNIKCILILCVVMGHLLEVCKAPGGDRIYRLIYFFHMPVFLFLTGFFAKQEPAARDVLRQVVTYIVFQTVYIFFCQLVLKQETVFQYTKPYWHLWYLLAVLFYTVLIPLYRTDSKTKQLCALMITVVLALLVGYESTIGYYMTLSRFFVFQPFFLMGFYYRQHEPAWEKYAQRNKGERNVLIVAAVVGAACTWLLTDGKWISKQMLYGSYAYEVLNYGINQRLVMFLAAIAWIAVFVLALKPLMHKKLPIISMIGANTMPVYLFHAWIVKLLGKLQPAYMHSWLFVVAGCIVCLLVFGNPIMAWCVRPRWRGKGC